jgi:MoaA/NifB/PqqE/SkfB family radical SAM enzyme
MRVNALLPTRLVAHMLHKSVGWPKKIPSSVTVSVTNQCNSQCKTCFIWSLYKDKPEAKKREFSADEFERTFASLGTGVVWVTFSGGEPFLRRDLAEICEAAEENCKPGIITIPTNCLLPQAIVPSMRKILERCSEPTFVINLSLDGLKGKHDEIRGIPGNWKRFLETYNALKDLKKEFENLHIGVHSVVSKFSIDGLLDLYEYVKELKPDSYITELAERRTELFNCNKDITPTPSAYLSFINELSRRLRRDYLTSSDQMSKLTQAFRITYYQIAAKILKENRQAIPCYAGIASCQITPYGDIWPCCILGYDMVMGNLRETDYDFNKVWTSRKADWIRRYIADKNCACPLANAHYTNMMCSPWTLLKVARNFVSS